MVEDDNTELGPGPTRLKTLTQIVLSRIAEHLDEEARQQGGSLDQAQIRVAVGSFLDRTDADALEFYRAGWNECLSVIDEVRRESGRRLPFERLMVRSFANLMPAAHQPVVPGKGLSRRILPGFLTALHQMLGPVLLDQYQNRCRELVRIIQTARGNDFEWRDVFDDPTSQVIVNDVLVHISKHFSDLPRRRSWMISLITSQLSLGEDETERAWVFSEYEFGILMEAMFRPLRNQMDSPEGKQCVQDRYGTLACDALADLFRELDQPANVTPLRRIAP